MFRMIALLAALASLPLLADDRRGRDDDRRWRDRDDYRRERDRDDRYRRERARDDDRYGRGGSYGRDRVVRRGSSPVDRTISDLRRAQDRNRYDSEKREHFERAFYHLDRFNSDWDRNNFNKDRLDDAIERVNKLANSDQIQSRDRDILRRDVEDLRQFRSSRGQDYGYRR